MAGVASDPVGAPPSVRLLTAGVAVLLALMLMAPAAAPASEGQQLLVEDEHHLLEASKAEQLRALDMMQELGVDKIRAVVWWRYMLAQPLASQRPAAHPGHPGSRLYDRERLAMLDSLVREARQRGIIVMLNPASASGIAGTHLHLPSWAISEAGSPSVPQFARFVKALARRYSGRYVPPGTDRPLPQVHEWSIWNEPNSRYFLSPQWRLVDGESIPWSPVLYRRLYTAAARTLRRNGHRRDRIYFGETTSSGLRLAAPFATMAPAKFVRELVCLDPELNPYTGEGARRRDCTGYRPLDTDGLATHFYTTAEGTAPVLPADADPTAWAPGDPARPAGLLAEIAARGRLPTGLPVYNTEAGFQSHPIRRPLLTAEGQAHNLNLAEYLQWRNPSVASFAQYLMYDDPFWHTGLRFIDGPPKLAYFAFRMPIVVRNLGNGTLQVWGASYGRGPARLTAIQANGLPATLLTTSDPRGYYQVTISGGPATVVQAMDVLTGFQSRIAIPTPGL
jgi:hypothetical protein